MRSLSASIKTILAFLALAYASCGGNSMYPALPPSETVTGEIVVEGSSPFTRSIFIVDDYGIKRMIKAPRVKSELALLEGHRIRIRGTITGSPRSGYTVKGSTYTLDVGEGETAVKGMLLEEENHLIIRPLDGSGDYVLEGGLKGALVNFTGCRAWVWGVDRVGRSGEEGYRSRGGNNVKLLDISGYEVICAETR